MVSEMAGAEKTGQRSYQAGFEVESVSKAGKVKPVKRKEEKKKNRWNTPENTAVNRESAQIPVS